MKSRQNQKAGRGTELPELCGSMMKKVREEKSYRVVQIPATEYIEEVIRYVYECPNCVDENDRPVTKSAKVLASGDYNHYESGENRQN